MSHSFPLIRNASAAVVDDVTVGEFSFSFYLKWSVARREIWNGNSQTNAPRQAFVFFSLSLFLYLN